VALQQHQAELAERQAQVVALTQQLAVAHEQQELLQQVWILAPVECSVWSPPSVHWAYALDHHQQRTAGTARTTSQELRCCQRRH
jgi:hypothetical protein